MQNIVGVIKGNEKLTCFKELLTKAEFEKTLLNSFGESGKDKNDFSIVIKPNMMVFVNPKAYKALVTDKELVEYLVDFIFDMGFRNICVCEAQNDVGRMLKNHNVEFVAEKIGYNPVGKYKIIDLTHESISYKYTYKDKKGKTKIWKDKIGKTWKDADFRITFAKCKTHEHDWMTLGVKNIYGCFPRSNKVNRYHIRNEVFDVTARSISNFKVHFSIIDAWVGSDGFQGYKIEHPRELKMFFGGNNAVSVDQEVFKRAGLDYNKSKFLKKAVEQLYDGVYPEYTVVGDKDTKFDHICTWENIDDNIVKSIDILEEVYIAWGFINLRPTAEIVDYSMFPPKNIFYRFLVWLSKKLYSVFKLFRFYKKLYQRKE